MGEPESHTHTRDLTAGFNARTDTAAESSLRVRHHHNRNRSSISEHYFRGAESSLYRVNPTFTFPQNPLRSSLETPRSERQSFNFKGATPARSRRMTADAIFPPSASGPQASIDWLPNHSAALGTESSTSTDRSKLIKDIAAGFSHVQYLYNLRDEIRNDLHRYSVFEWEPTTGSSTTSEQKKEDAEAFLNNIPLAYLDSAIMSSAMLLKTFEVWRKAKLDISESHKHQKSISISQQGKPTTQSEFAIVHEGPSQSSKKKRFKRKASQGPPAEKEPKSIKKRNRAKKNLSEDLGIKVTAKCLQCGSIDTPEWRRGPYGARSLCNACGLFHAKLTRRLGVEKADSTLRERLASGMGADRHIPNTK